MPIDIKMLVFLPGKMRSDHHKNHGCGQKIPEGTNSAIFGMGPLQMLQTQPLC